MLHGKNALVFAAYGEVSAAVAKQLAALGATVHLSGRDEERVKDIASKITIAGGKATAARVNAQDESAVNQYVEGIAANGLIDFVFNGIGLRAADAEYATTSTTLPYSKFMLSIDTLVGSQFLTARAAAPYMMKAGSGAIVLLSSTLKAGFFPLMAGVTAACGGVEALTQVLAGEFGPAGVRVNCVRPTAMVNTRTIRETNARFQKAFGKPEDTPPRTLTGALQREVTVEDTAGVVAYLFSPLSASVTGQVLNVCGGQFIT